jgi:peptide/nickel transport system permease protein
MSLNLKDCTLVLMILGFWVLVPSLVSSRVTYSELNLPPGLDHWCGTGEAGEDVLTLALHGTRSMLLWGIYASGLTAVAGFLFGMFMAGAGEGAARRIVGVFVAGIDMLGPLLPVAAFAAAFPRANGWSLGLVVAIVAWPAIAGPVESALRREMKQQYIEAAISLGLSKTRIFWRHIFPVVLDVLAPWIGAFACQIIALYAALQFLGVGTSGARSLGASLYQASASMGQAPWAFLSLTGAFILLQMSLILIAQRLSVGREAE